MAIKVDDRMTFAAFLWLCVWGGIGWLWLRGEIYEHARSIGQRSNPLEQEERAKVTHNLSACILFPQTHYFNII